MSVKYTHYLLLGLRFEEEKLWKTDKVRGCQHKIKGKDKFCSICGKKTWVNKEVPIEGYNENDEDLEKYGCESLCGFKIMFGGYENSLRYIGLVLINSIDYDSYDKKMEDSVFESLSKLKATLKEKIKEKTEPLGLWHEESFGFWMIEYVC